MDPMDKAPSAERPASAGGRALLEPGPGLGRPRLRRRARIGLRHQPGPGRSRLEKGKGICVAEWLVEKNVDEVWLKGEMRHRGPGYVFSDAGIAVREFSGDNIDQALQESS